MDDSRNRYPKIGYFFAVLHGVKRETHAFDLSTQMYRQRFSLTREGQRSNPPAGNP